MKNHSRTEKKYSGPDEGELVAITILDLEKRTIGWSPGLKRSVYVNEFTEPEVIRELKRVREADVVTAYDQMSDRTLFIELDAPEREHFDEVYSQYLEAGGQILYTRRKEGRKMRSVFMLDKTAGPKKVADLPERRFLFS